MPSAALKLLSPLCKSRFLPEIVVILFSVGVWSLIGLGPYSGFNTPPQYGDFEAQRHWLELTVHLPLKKWYFYSPDWWRLDYPPLTAYHSLLLGLIGDYVYPLNFELETSRGVENSEVKSFMRNTVIVSQLLLFVWPLLLFSKRIEKRTSRLIALGSVLLLPSLAIIDHGHFQYNSVMLGLFITSVHFLLKKRYSMASFFFVSTLFFKQMALYYAPAIFFIILGSVWGPRTNFKFNFWLLVEVGSVVVLTALLYLAPFLTSLDQLQQILTRVFPVGRGLWEDKVANVWCTINYLGYKLKENFSPSQLQALALSGTLLAMTPSCLAGYFCSSESWAAVLANCAWAFFLFSFQVHEKSVLLPLLASWLTCMQHWKSRDLVAMTRWISNISYFSLWPLLSREGLHLQYFALFVLYNYLFTSKANLLPRNWLCRLVVCGSYISFLGVAFVEYFGLISEHVVERYPDLFIVGNMAISLGSFGFYWIWQMWFMFSQPNHA